jgi:hypothetical protein
MRFPATAAVFSGILVLLLAPIDSRAAAPTACQLLDAKSASSLLGEEAGPPTEMQGKLCIYSAKKGDGEVTLGFNTADEARFTHAEQAAKAAAGTTVEEPSGLGDRSMLVEQADGTTLGVLYHGQSVGLSVKRKLTPELKAQMIQVMKQVLGKL